MAVKVKLKGVDEEFEKLDKETIQFINQSTRALVLRTTGELKRVTPVDTGRARNSWTATTNPTEFVNTLISGSGAGSSMFFPVSETKLEKYYITNGVNYIDKLNAGSSRQAPARFIENTVLKYFEIEGLVYSKL